MKAAKEAEDTKGNRGLRFFLRHAAGCAVSVIPKVELSRIFEKYL